MTAKEYFDKNASKVSILKVIPLLLFLPFVLFSQAFVLYYAWAWFVVATGLTTVKLSFPVMVGFLLVKNLFTGNESKDKENDIVGKDEVFVSVISKIIMPWLSLLLMFVAHLFV